MKNQAITVISLAFILAAGALGFVENVEATDYRFTIEHQGIERFYLIHVPDSYNENNPTPVVLAFHGGAGNAESFTKYYNFIEESDQEGFIVVFPNGACRPIHCPNIATWNAGTCCSYAVDSNSDDVGFVKKMMKKLEDDFNIDENRIYATGHSNGGMFSYRLACEMSNEFAAIAANAGTENILSCNPSRAIPVFHIHALNDGHVYFNGGCSDCSVNSGLDYTSVNETIERWVLRNNCNPTPERVLEIVGSDGVYCDEYTGCSNGVRVKICATQDGGHSWPGGQKTSIFSDTPTQVISATHEMWEFFEKHPMPQAGDVNGDGSVNILDVQACVNHLLGAQDWGAAADVNRDGTVNVLDVQEIVNIILGG
ncbi:MAG: dockerin type I domain-containing protein [Candidatus Altiarchaeota archaeon]|nr:dockerin type I domain-containing protein [Candidatus Altiarchaeota archaeon]